MILDNGRSNLLRGRYREMLACIRCGACLNVCPVYRKTGGAAYGPVYSGPMGAVLVPLLVGLEQAPSLPHASSLCGACTDACPVKIPLHELLLELRRDLVEEGVAPRRERLAFTLWSYAWSSPLGYRLSTRARAARAAARRARRAGAGVGAGPHAAEARPPLPGPAMSLVDEFAANAEAVGLHRPPRRRAGDRGRRRLAGALRPRRHRVSVVLAASPDEPRASSLLPDVHVTLVCRGPDPPGSTSSSPRSATTCRARSRSSPARAGAPTSSRSSRSASTAPARCTSCSFRLDSCCRSSAPAKIICVGLNYRDHAEEQGATLPEAPLLFAKWQNTLIGPGEPIAIPPIVTKCDYEAELGVVIGDDRPQRLRRERARGGRRLHLRQRRLGARPPVRGRPVDARQVARHVLPRRPAARPARRDARTRRRSRSGRS